MTTASLMDEKDREKQRHDLSQRRDLWLFSSGPNILTSSAEPASRNRCIINGIPKAIDWLPVQALKFSRALCPGSDMYLSSVCP